MHTWSGLSLAGMVEVPVDTAYKGRFLTHILNDSGVEVLVAEDRYLDRLAAVASDLTHLRTVVVRGDAAAAGAGLTGRFQVVPFGEVEAAPALAPVTVAPSDLIASISAPRGDWRLQRSGESWFGLQARPLR